MLTTRSVWYIGSDKALYQVGNVNFVWQNFPNQTSKYRPAADEAGAAFAIASDFSSSSCLRLLFREQIPDRSQICQQCLDDLPLPWRPITPPRQRPSMPLPTPPLLRPPKPIRACQTVPKLASVWEYPRRHRHRRHRHCACVLPAEGRP